MPGTLWRGVFLAVLAMAAGELPSEVSADCDGATQGCDADEALSSSKDELQGLELLQMEVRLQSDLVSPAATHAAAPSLSAEQQQHQPLLTKAAKNLVEVEVRAAPAPIANAADEEKLVVSRKPVIEQASALDDAGFRSVFSSLSLIEESSTVKHNGLHTMELFVAGIRAQGSSTVWIIVVLIVLLSVLGFFAGPILFGRGSQMDDKRQGILPARASPGAQQLLQAPRSTNPAQSPIIASTLDRPDAGAGQVAKAAELPPICPSLILPHTEARFMIPIESLMRASGELDIRGTSGRKLLHGSVSETPEGHRCLALASCGCEEDPRVTLIAPASSFAQGPLAGGPPQEGGMGVMQLYGKGRKFYGTLEPATGGGALLRCEGEIVMSLEIGGDLRMTASSMDGRLLASAGKNVQVSARRLESHDTWKLQVKPNFDAVLIAACMLGALLFGQ